MAKSRYMVNNAGGLYVRYPEIISTMQLLRRDGVHWTEVGNNIFLNKIQGGLEYFILGTGGHVLPPK